jgi:ABC-type cobalamin/Fe3+-siderophores transport system ATPase subunit
METIETFCRAEKIRIGYDSALSSQESSFSIPRGLICAVLGKNGCGKTTLLRSFTGEGTLISGDIFVHGEEKSVRTWGPAQISRNIAYVGQEHLYPSELLGRDLLRFAYISRTGIFGRLPQSTDEMEYWIKALELQDLVDRPVGRLSTGERQRLFLVRAILQNPKILLLDEPTNHLDPAGIAAFWSALTHARKKLGFEIVLSTHDLNFVKEHCEWACCLEKGDVIYNGTTKELFRGDFLRKLFGEKWWSSQTAVDVTYA